MATLIPCDGPGSVVVPAGEFGYLTLGQIEDAVGGHFELLKTTSPRVQMAVNEDGQRLQLPPNTHATALVHHRYLIAGCIRGPVLLIPDDELE